MIRYQIYQPVVTSMQQQLRQHRARSLIDLWTEVVHSWTLAHAWELPRAPWSGETKEHLPVVVWLKKQQLPYTPRGGKNRESQYINIDVGLCKETWRRSCDFGLISDQHLTRE